jgi:hypothetical protein
LIESSLGARAARIGATTSGQRAAHAIHHSVERSAVPDLLAAALAYAEQGIAVFPVRVVRVTSAQGDRKKVWPIGSWRNTSTTDVEQIRAWFGQGALWADASLAIDCGKSGLVVVDADGAAGVEQLRQLADAGLPIGNGVNTPGGGQHWYYRADPDHPVSIDSSAKVAPGVDVRGAGGFVIAPPSADWRGAYEWLDEPRHWDGLEPVPALIIERMGAKKAPELQLDDFGPTVQTTTSGSSDPAPFDLPARQFTRAAAIDFCAPYLAALRAAPVGQINHRLNDAAKVLSHFNGIEGFWSAADARQWLHNALEPTEYDGATWKADDTIASAFRSASASWRAEYVADPFVTGGTEPAPPEPSAVDAMLAEMLTPDQLIERPPPTPLIMDWLDLDSLAWLIGKPGSYKSFLALDWAAHIGQGVPWRAHPVAQGEVIYLVAEGTTGMGMRVRAWQERHGPMKSIRFLPRPVQASGQEWAVLVEACRQVGPKLIILDTQARVTVGMDENDNTEMGKFIHRAEELRAATGACVLIVHHIGRNGEDARGASALDGAQSTEVKIKRSDRGPLWAVIEQDKQKDMAEAEPVEVGLDVVELGQDRVTGRQLSSLVLAPVDPFGVVAAKVRDWIDNLTENQAELFGVMADHFPDNGATKAELSAAVRERRAADERPMLAKSSFFRAWDGLVSKELFLKIKGSQRFMINPDETSMDMGSH